MALFKTFRGKRADLGAQELRDGFAYFCTDDGTFHIDFLDTDGQVKRKQINAKDAETLLGHSIEEFLTASENGSFAHGDHVTADANYQTTFGTYNEVNTDAAFIVGNGDSSKKSNALEVNKDGNVYVQQSLFVQGTGANQGVAQEVATIETVENAIASKTQVQFVTWEDDD